MEHLLGYGIGKKPWNLILGGTDPSSLLPNAFSLSPTIASKKKEDWKGDSIF